MTYKVCYVVLTIDQPHLSGPVWMLSFGHVTSEMKMGSVTAENAVP